MIVIFIFYNKAQGKQDRYTFSKYFRHIDIFTFHGDKWIVHRFGSDGITYRISRFTEGSDILDHLVRLTTVFRIAVVNVIKRTKFRWLPLWGRTCNELARYIAGIDIGLTYSPRHLYSKLLRYDHIRNYKILTLWRVCNGQLGREQ